MSSTAAVNRPTDSKQKEKDIETKLRLWAIYQAFKNGKLPSNKQCDIAINSALASRALTNPSKELSEEGRGLVKDLRDVIEHSKKLMLSKNDGQLLQDFIWEAENISPENVQAPNAPVDKESAQQDAVRLKEGLKTIGTLLITNGEFRKLLNDATILLRDIAGDASQKAAETVRPSQEQLSQMDQPAESNVWHEKPDLSKENIKSQLKSAVDQNAPGAREGVSQAASKAQQAATGGQDPRTAENVDVRSGAVAGGQQLKEHISENTPEDAKNRTRELADKTKNYLSQKMPQERREQAIWRLKKMVVECQGHADYQQAIETLLSLAEKYAGHTKGLHKEGTGTVQNVRGNDSVSKMENDLRILIERFANSTSLDDFFEALNNIYRDADQDPELKKWFKQLDTYIRKCLREPGFIMRDEATSEWNQLYDHGRFLLRDRYRNHTDRIADEAKFIADQFNQDAYNRAFADSMDKLFKDLGRDTEGNVAFKKHLLVDIRDVILPAIFENIRYVPIPRIEVSDPAADVVVENLVVESDNLMPNVLEFGSDNYFRWGRKKISNKRDNKIMISASGIQADIRDISYYIKKKQGFPSLSDMGIMDVFLGGEGFSFKIVASNAQEVDRQRFVKLEHVSVSIKNMDIKLRKSKHKLLFTIFKPMLFSVVRPALQKVLEKQIRDAFNKADAFAYKVHTEAQKARDAAREDPANAPNIYSRYVDAIRAKLTEKKQKAEAVAQRGTKVQMATTHHESLFPNIKLPGGISNQATKYYEMAKQGDRWESPVFTIGSAKESTDIPRPAAVTRKQHQRAEGRLQDRQPDGPAQGQGQGQDQGQFGQGQTQYRQTAGDLYVNAGAASDPYMNTGATTARTAVPTQTTTAFGQTSEGQAIGTNTYPSRGFSDEVNQAFSNGQTDGLTSLKSGVNGANGVGVTNGARVAPPAFDPHNI